LAVWLLAFPISYYARSLAKLTLIQRNRFGEPYLVVGAGPVGHQVLRDMHRNRELGQVPVGVFSDFSELWDKRVEDVPVLGPIDLVTNYIPPYPIRHVLIALGNTPENRARTEELIALLSKVYPSVQTLVHLAETSNLLVTSRAIGPHLALEVKQPRLLPRQSIIKRALDLAVGVPALCVAVPIIAVAALSVKIVSPGPTFFAQVREGKHGKPIRIWKIRTMVLDAEKRLAEHLASNSAARFEYERTLKLRLDPRVIPRVGHSLRRTSIDELPQLWNVVRGDLTLVGPRVMLAHEVERFSEKGRELRRDVPPGLTGLWQILYRNNSDIQIWEAADSYYVNNWSIWMDLWILFRTVRVVVTRAGAF
jgi:Undecaprenyl-phosphate galactose phosphotransferase WbaP